jgi:GAF domain-containing protein
MPSITCPSCAVTTYRTRQEACPCCGAGPAAGAAPPTGPRPRLASASPVPEVLALARARTGVEAVLVTEVDDGREVVRGIDRDDMFPSLEPGMSTELSETICDRLLTGRVGNLVADVRADPELADLSLVRFGGIGAYLGVPMTAADARVYVLCCLALEARPDLGPDAVDFMRGLATRLRATIDAYSPAPFL